MAEVKAHEPVAYVRHALANNAFAVYCQPIAALGQRLSFPIAEALVRLEEEEASFCPPGEFLPVLEHYGLMPDLDRWVVRQVLQRLAGGANLRLSVNLSAQTLADSAFPRFVAEHLAASRVPADRLLFEVDEPDAFAHADHAARLGVVLGRLGCGIIIDGLGHGPSLVQPLRIPSVRFIKVCSSITRQLVAPEPISEPLTELLQAASGMGIHVIAECVEDPATLPALVRRGVRLAQGFGISPPHPIDACLERLAAKAA